MHINIPDLRGERLNYPINDFTVIDIETTGLSYKDYIIDFGAVKVRSGQPIETFTTLINPKVQISENITDLTGITNEMLKDQLEFADVAKKIVDFIGDDIIMGHNVIFDIDRLNFHLYDLGYDTIPNDYIDTMLMAKDTHQFNSLKLGDIARQLEINVETEHRALADCQTALRCFSKIKNLHHIDLHKITPEQIIERYTALKTHIYDFSSVRYKMVGSFVDSDMCAIYKALDMLGATETTRYEKCDHFYLGKLSYNRYIAGEESIKLSSVREQDKLGKTVLSETELYEVLGIATKKISSQESTTHRHYSSKLKQEDCIPELVLQDINHILHGKTIVITGELHSMTRREAYRLIKSFGGLCGDNVTKKTDYLVTNSAERTGKMKKALKYINDGFDIKIINENDLYCLLNS